MLVVHILFFSLFSTVSEAIDCRLISNQPVFLFAYSNDLNPVHVILVKDRILRGLRDLPQEKMPQRFANVRFDTNNTAIFHHNDAFSFSTSVNMHPPDRSLSLKDDQETNVFEVLENFLLNSSSCGSKVFILAKRRCQKECPYSNENLIPALLDQHITVNILQSNYPSTYFYNDLLFLSADKTNGIVANFGKETENNDASLMNITSKLMGMSDLLVYSDYMYHVGSFEGKRLEDLYVPWYQNKKLVNVTLMISTEMFAGINMYELTLTIQNQATQKNTTVRFHPKDFFLDSSLIFKEIQLESDSHNHVYLDFRTRALSNIQIRMLIDRFIPEDQ